jgi:hypothetical protein
VELDWLSGVVSDAHQLAAQGMNRLNVLHVNAKGAGLGQSILGKVKRCTDRLRCAIVGFVVFVFVISGGPGGCLVIDKSPNNRSDRRFYCSVLRNSIKSWI